MSSVRSFYEKTLTNGIINNSSFGGKLKVHKDLVTPFLPLITEDNEYESTDGWKAPPLKAPRWNRAQETRCDYIARVGMRFSKDDYTSPYKLTTQFVVRE